MENVLVTGFCGGYLCSMNINELKPDGRNYNKGTDKGRKLVKRSLKELGAGRSVLVDKDGNIIAGNKTVEAAKALGYDNILIVPTDGKTLVAVQRTDVALDSEQGRALALADNATASAGIAWDFDMMAADGWGEGDLTGWGVDFEQPEKKAVDDEFEPPEIDEIKTDIQRGDIIEIGPHRLMCGDSTVEADVDRLMGGEKADMIFTDPPHDFTENQHCIILDTCLQSSKFDVFILSATRPLLKLSQTDSFNDFFVHDFVFHIGNGGGPLRQYDLIAHFRKGRFFNQNEGFSNCVRINSMRMGGYKRMHEHEKQVELVDKFLRHYSKIGELCTDFFCGSGTTMVAAHQLSRRCFGMEIDPKYCQVIVDRMRKLDPNIEIKKNGQPYPVTAI